MVTESNAVSWCRVSCFLRNVWRNAAACLRCCSNFSFWLTVGVQKQTDKSGPLKRLYFLWKESGVIILLTFHGPPWTIVSLGPY